MTSCKPFRIVLVSLEIQKMRKKEDMEIQTLLLAVMIYV